MPIWRNCWPGVVSGARRPCHHRRSARHEARTPEFVAERVLCHGAVVLVSDVPTTLSELRSYVANSGMSVVATSVLAEVDGLSSRAAALVLFPDGFPVREIDDLIARLARRRRPLLLVVVTTDPQRFHNGASGEALHRVVLPRPSFGWNIVDAVRTRGGRS